MLFGLPKALWLVDEQRQSLCWLHRSSWFLGILQIEIAGVQHSIHEYSCFSPIFLPSGKSLYWNSDSSLSLTLSYVTTDIIYIYMIHICLCVYMYLCKHIVKCPLILELAHKINLFGVPSAPVSCHKYWVCWVFLFNLFVVWRGGVFKQKKIVVF